MRPEPMGSGTDVAESKLSQLRAHCEVSDSREGAGGLISIQAAGA